MESLGWNVGPLAFALHFGYGALWSMILVSLFGRETDASKGIGLALALWLIMMVVYSPFIGWGLFGFGPASQLPAGHPLHLAPGPLYLTLTLAQHLVYGGMIGWLNPLWLRQELAEPEIRMHRRRAA